MARKRQLKVKITAYPDSPVLVTEALLRLYELHKDKLKINSNR